MEDDTQKQSNSNNGFKNKPWLFQPGKSGNPGGKKKGTVSLKTWAKKYLETLDDEEKLKFMKGLPKEIIWKMAEGNPAQDLTTAGEKISVVPIYAGQSIQGHNSNEASVPAPKKN